MADIAMPVIALALLITAAGSASPVAAGDTVLVDARTLEAIRQERVCARAGITSDKTVVTYCQTHHRAAVGYVVLRLLGYPRIAAYDRSWAEWGNREDLPVAR